MKTKQPKPKYKVGQTIYYCCGSYHPIRKMKISRMFFFRYNKDYTYCGERGEEAVRGEHIIPKFNLIFFWLKKLFKEL